VVQRKNLVMRVDQGPEIVLAPVVMTVVQKATIQNRAVVIVIRTVGTQEKRRKKKRKGSNMLLTVFLKGKNQKNQTSLILRMHSNLYCLKWITLIELSPK